MGANRSDNVFETFIIARFAQWAGDFDFAQEMYGKIAHQKYHKTFPDAMEGPSDVIRVSAAFRNRQISQKKEEFKLIVNTGLNKEQQDIDYQPVIIETVHLRGALWRLGSREFRLRAFLSDLSWEKELFAIARELANKDLFPGQNEEIYSPFSGSWEARLGEAFMQVFVDDMALIEVDGFWIGDTPPKSAENVKEKFMKVLLELDQWNERSSIDDIMEGTE
jgi:hypothetical protein